jgi:hypothetical protein
MNTFKTKLLVTLRLHVHQFGIGVIDEIIPFPKIIGIGVGIRRESFVAGAPAREGIIFAEIVAVPWVGIEDDLDRFNIFKPSHILLGQANGYPFSLRAFCPMIPV